MNSGPPSRLFAMSAVTALIKVRQHQALNPNWEGDTASLLKAIDPSSASADFDSAIAIHQSLPREVDFADLQSGLQSLLFWLINEYRPWWRKLIPYGRERLRSGLSEDEIQTFRSCGLFSSPASTEIVDWWDRLAAIVRAERDNALGDQGRYAERLTLEYETKRLQQLGIALTPIWVALDDNGAGYDVRSYDVGQASPINRLIEVKSTISGEPQMILTRNEWDTAAKAGESYFFYVWRLPSEELTIWSSKAIGAAVPSDQPGGRWREASIAI
jgi:hypothetical protein